jgi:iron complex transport system permease protein
VRQENRITLLYLIPLPVLILSLFVGPSDAVSAAHIFQWLGRYLFGWHPDPELNLILIQSIIMDVRLPRILLTFLVGGALASSGNTLQAIFRNPLVSPYILGLSSGAAFGAALSMATGWLPVQPAAFICGLFAVGLSYFLARTGQSVSVVNMVLAGIIVNGIFTAILTIVQFLSDPFKLQTIVHWTMGNLHNASWTKLESAFIPMMIGTVGMFLMRWRMNVLALGDDETRAVGLNPDKEKLIMLAPATLAASGSVAVAGVISMVGLVIPHMVRMMIGPDNTRNIPACFAFGGSFLLVVDNFSRTLAAFEIPVGIFTMLIGGPFFIYLMRRSRIGWES